MHCMELHGGQPKTGGLTLENGADLHEAAALARAGGASGAATGTSAGRRCPGQHHGRPRTLPFQLGSTRVQRCLDPSRLCQEARAWIARSFLELFQEEARTFVVTDLATSYKLSKDHVDEAFFETELAKLSTDDGVMPKMRCSDLVACSCDDPCDWETAFRTAHDFSDAGLLQNLSDHPVFVKVVDAEHSLADFVHESKFKSYSSEVSVLPAEEQSP